MYIRGRGGVRYGTYLPVRSPSTEHASTRVPSSISPDLSGLTGSVTGS